MPGQLIGNIEYDAEELDLVNLWQYDNAPRLMWNDETDENGNTVRKNGIIGSFIEFFKKNVSEFHGDWLRDVFNVDTANEFGLSLWGEVIGVPRITYTDPDTHQTALVSVELYRRMLKGRFFSLGCDGTIPDINHYLQVVFPGKPVFVRDNYDMSVTIIAYIEPTAEEKAVLLSPGFLPIPAGVKSSIVVFARNTFGFEGSLLEDFRGGTAPDYTGGVFLTFY